MPADHTDQSAARHYAAIVLAAGYSRRFGVENKLLAEIDGSPILEHVLAAVAASGVGQRLIVTGQPDVRIDALAKRVGFQIVRNAENNLGMGTSIARGIAQVEPGMAGAFIVLGDMPFVPPAILAGLAGLINEAHSIARPMTAAGPGHPVLFARRHFPALLALTGDSGAGKVIAAAPGALATLTTADPGVVDDFDTPQDIANYRTGPEG